MLEEAIALVEAAARAGQFELNRIVQAIRFDPVAMNPFFSVDDASGIREVVIAPRTLTQTRGLQLKDAMHELVHANHFNELAEREGNWRVAWAKFRLLPCDNRFQWREVTTEFESFIRIKRYYEGQGASVPPEVVEDSKAYIDLWLADILFFEPSWVELFPVE